MEYIQFEKSEVKHTASLLLRGYFLEQFENGSMNFLQALREQERTRALFRQADKDFQAGNYYEATPKFFQEIIEEAHARRQ